MAVAIPYVISALAATALSFAAQNLLAKKAKTPITDEKPNSPSTRGSYVPLMVGRRRVGANVSWVGDRTVVTESAAGGKGGTGSGASQLVYYESASHIIAVGPATRLHRIWSNGKIVYEPAGGITNLTHPSGTSISVPDLGTFKIYWGEADGPVDTFLGASTRIGVLSRWKFCARVVWIQARLGGFPTWPAIEYELEVRPYKAGYLVGVDYDSLPDRLTDSTGWLDNEFGYTGTTFNILDGFDYLEVPPKGNMKVSGDQTANFPAGALVRVVGQPFSEYASREFTIVSSSYSAGEIVYSAGTNIAGPSLGLMNTAAWQKVNCTIGGGPGGPNPGGANTESIVRTTPSLTTTAEWNGAHGSTGGVNLLGRYRTRLTLYVYRFGIGGVDDITFGIRPFSGATTHSHTGRLQWIGGQTVLTLSNNLRCDVVQFNADYKRLDIFFIGGHGNPASDNSYNLTLLVDITNCTASTVYIAVGTNDKNDGTAATGITTVRFEETIRSVNDHVGTLEASIAGYGPGGPNAAHLIDQLLFETYPHGAGLDRSLFDIDSLEEIGVLLEAEGLRTNVIGQDGNEFEAVLGTILQDVGLMVGWDRVSGLFKFTLIRDPAALPSIPNIPEQLIAEPKPERFSQREQRPDDKALFGFSDAALNYRDNVIVDTDDAIARIDQNQKGNVVQMPTVIDEKTALVVAERRSAEVLVALAKSSVTVLRDAGDFYPGQACDIYDFDSTQRVLEVKAQAKTRRTILEVATDSYAIVAGTEQLQAAYSPPPRYEPVADVITAIVELPEQLRLAARRAIAILRIRGAVHIGAAAGHLSGDDLTYTRVADNLKFVTGGSLFEEFAASGVDIATGPIFYGFGPDVASLSQTLTTDDRDLGRQLLFCEDEIMFVQEIVPLGDNMYRIDGIQRGKYGTTAAAHAVDSMVYIVDPKRLDAIYDPLIEASVVVYAKTQPRTASSAISLAAVSSVNKTISSLPPTPITEFFAETPAGTINGVNDTFTLAAPPNPPESLILEKNGIGQTESIDYSILGSTIQFSASNIPLPGDIVIARRYLSL